MIAMPEFRAMKRRPLLINTARGGLVNEADLATALREGLIAGAGFDVLTAEPPADDNPLLGLLDMPNFILTPHVAWASDEAMQALADQLIDNIENFVRGRSFERRDVIRGGDSSACGPGVAADGSAVAVEIASRVKQGPYCAGRQAKRVVSLAGRPIAASSPATISTMSSNRAAMGGVSSRPMSRLAGWTPMTVTWAGAESSSNSSASTS